MAQRIRNLWNDGKFEPKIADFCDPRTSSCKGLFSSETGNLSVRRTIHWGLAGGIFGNGGLAAAIVRQVNRFWRFRKFARETRMH